MRKYGSSAEESEFSVKDQPTLTFHDYLVLKFEEFVLPKEIRIYETFNPGTVVRIYAYNELPRHWELLWEANTLEHVEKKAREFCPPIKNNITIVSR